MFTVKIVYPDGSENVFQTRNVSTRAANKSTSNIGPAPTQSVFFQEEGGADIELTVGETTVYVMNDNGKTVSKYFGQENPVPAGSE